MERYKIEKRHRKKVPRVPIKTYKWEDIRRARLKGGYPWTYLYKEPFNENIDPRLFTMESKLKIKSKVSTKLLESSDRLEIKEVSNGGDTPQDSLTPEPSGYIVITEVPSDSESHSKDVPGGSVTIEDIGDGETLNLESAESSDNISQYLDKEEPVPEPAETSKKSEEAKTENGRNERAKSEEPKRKRKLSIDSSYSRKSLSKLAIMKKLKDAKNKIKVPKLNLPSLPNVMVLSNPLKDDKHGQSSKKEKEKKQDKPKEFQSHFKSDPNAKPEYIHIPLKPPEGQTDEFSYLEFGEKKPEEPIIKEEPEKQQPEEKQLEAPTIEISEPYDDRRRFSGDPDDIVAFEILKAETIDIDQATKNGFQGGSDYLIIEQEDDAKSESRSMIIIMSDPEEQENNKPLSRAGSQRLSRQGSSQRLSRQGSSKTLSRAGSQKQIASKEENKKVRAKSAEPEKKRKLSADSSYSRISTSKVAFLKKLKNARDKLKLPKFSLSKQDSKKKSKEHTTESQPAESEIKKTESKKNEPKYIHIPLKPPPGQSDEFSYLEYEEKKEKAEAEKTTITEKEPEKQDSVDSPTSPKEGVQFIFLTPPSDDEILDQPEIPETPSSENSQLFFSNRINELKEIAKDALDTTSKKLQPVVEEEASDVSSIKSEHIQEQEKSEEKIQEDQKKTNKDEEKKDKINEDKLSKDKENEEKLSKDEEKKEESQEVTETEKQKKTKGKSKKKKDKQEEEKKTQESEEIKPEDNIEKQEPEKVEKMVVDEEDGLKLTESAMAKQEQNVKAKEVVEMSQEIRSSLKTDGSPVFKKKVSFKRRSKDSKDSKDDDYEDIQVPTDDKSTSNNATDEQKSKLGVMGASQSMSVDEEKSYLDEQKIIKSTSLEEDYNRWSKLSDHEYEPVNPPPDNMSPISAAPPTVHVIDTDRGLQPKAISLASSTTSLERRMLGAEIEPSQEETHETTEQMQSEIEKKYFNKSAETPSQPQTTVHTITTITTQSDKSEPKKQEGPNKFQQAIKAQTDKFKTKLHEMKKPNIKLPSKPTIKKPNLQKFKFERPKINLPKIPDTAKITLPTFSLPRKSPLKRSLKQRHLSTESNAGGSKKNYFDFRTYPRLFKKKPKHDIDSFSSKSEREAPEFATVPRTKRNKVDENDRWGGRDTIRIPLHAEDSIEDEEREDSVERRMASHIRYDQDIDIDDAYEKENQEIHTASPFSHDYNSRWNHGSFHPGSELESESRNRQVTDLDSPGDGPHPHESFDTNTSKDIHSSESSLGIHRRGVLEEIDSDEFFLRQKGISQDNIEVGMYLSSEIREAFKYPSNALADLQRGHLDYSYDPRASNQSLPEAPTKRKAVKKPKRKKTPHVSQEQISFDQDSELDTELPPPRPKRRSKRNKKQKDVEAVIPYQETIAVDVPDVTAEVLQDSNEHEQFMYENEQMQGKEQPEIVLSDPYAEHQTRYDSEEEIFKEEPKPAAPPRKQRSLKSLSYSEHDSILGDVDPDREPPVEEIEVYKTEHEYIIPTPEIPPTKPKRTLSRSSSKSRGEEDFRTEIQETPIRPTRTRSSSRTRSRAESLTIEEPCIEETCVEDFRDCMGYAVIDKNTKREPPLPPPRTPPRRKKLVQSNLSEQRFFTVPRPLNDEPPTRPLRNYSTLGPSRPPRRKQPINMTDEEKENIDITQYIEIDEEPNRDLISGEVIQKMRDRPLPAPPRPPRKTRALQDITSQENIVTQSQENIDGEEEKVFVDEAEVSTQTEPLPDDFLCEETNQDIAAIEAQQVEEKIAEPITVERRLITPTNYTFEEETITHGSLVVEPLNGARILPDSEFSRIEKPKERTIPVTKDYEDETSEIPEEFTKLKDPEPVESSQKPAESTPSQPSVIERIIERPVRIQPDSNTEVEVLKAQKLQVSDLDVDRLSVNELLASRIVVSEIDSGSIQTNELSSKSGAIKVGEIELPPGLVQQLFEKLQSVLQEQQSSVQTDPKPVPEASAEEASEDSGQKKTPIEEVMVEMLPPQRPPRKIEETYESSDPALIEEPQIDVSTQIDLLKIEELEEIQAEPPEPPTRIDSVITELKPEPEPITEEKSLETSTTIDSTIKESELEALELELQISTPKDPQSESVQEIEEVIELIPQRPPRQSEKIKSEETQAMPVVVAATTPQHEIKEPSVEPRIEPSVEPRIEPEQMLEPEVDDEPPPRPPEPPVDYIPSQPPASFYALKAQHYVDSLEGDIPMAPRRRRHQKPPISRSSSEDSPHPPPSRRRYRSPEPSIPQLTGQLLQACGSAANSSIKRLIAHISNNVLRNSDGQQDLHVMIVILLVLIAGLILLGFGDGKTVHHHHWEFFNPPKDM